MKERLQKILSAHGVASRRHAEEMIAAGRVSCNGQICKLGDSADPELDTICVDGQPITEKSSYVYIMLHKPRGYVTTMSDEKGRKCVASLVKDCDTRIYPIGRLDMDSDGLLLFTNNGDLANKLMHPKHEVKKTYRVLIKNYSDNALEKLKEPIELDGYMIRKPEVALLEHNGDKAVVLVTIHEGRNRQVRRMCSTAGLTVLRLTRISEGALQLGDLPIGKWRYLTNGEVEGLLRG